MGTASRRGGRASTLCYMPAPLPKYRQIVEDLRARIRAGEYAPGGQLPSLSKLTAKHGVAGGTVDKAIAILEAEGLVRSEHGKGTYVVDPLPEVQLSEADRVQAQIADLQEQIRRLAERLEFHQEHEH